MIRLLRSSITFLVVLALTSSTVPAQPLVEIIDRSPLNIDGHIGIFQQQALSPAIVTAHTTLESTRSGPHLPRLFFIFAGIPLSAYLLSHIHFFQSPDHALWAAAVPLVAMVTSKNYIPRLWSRSSSRPSVENIESFIEHRTKRTVAPTTNQPVPVAAEKYLLTLYEQLSRPMPKTMQYAARLINVPPESITDPEVKSTLEAFHALDAIVFAPTRENAVAHDYEIANYMEYFIQSAKGNLDVILLSAAVNLARLNVSSKADQITAFIGPLTWSSFMESERSRRERQNRFEALDAIYSSIFFKVGASTLTTLIQDLAFEAYDEPSYRSAVRLMEDSYKFNFVAATLNAQSSAAGLENFLNRDPNLKEIHASVFGGRKGVWAFYSKLHRKGIDARTDDSNALLKEIRNKVQDVIRFTIISGNSDGERLKFLVNRLQQRSGLKRLIDKEMEIKYRKDHRPLHISYEVTSGQIWEFQIFPTWDDYQLYQYGDKSHLLYKLPRTTGEILRQTDEVNVRPFAFDTNLARWTKVLDRFRFERIQLRDEQGVPTFETRRSLNDTKVFPSLQDLHIELTTERPDTFLARVRQYFPRSPDFPNPWEMNGVRSHSRNGSGIQRFELWFFRSHPGAHKFLEFLSSRSRRVQITVTVVDDNAFIDSDRLKIEIVKRHVLTALTWPELGIEALIDPSFRGAKVLRNKIGDNVQFAFDVEARVGTHLPLREIEKRLTGYLNQEGENNVRVEINSTPEQPSRLTGAEWRRGRAAATVIGGLLGVMQSVLLQDIHAAPAWILIGAIMGHQFSSWAAALRHEQGHFEQAHLMGYTDVRAERDPDGGWTVFGRHPDSGEDGPVLNDRIRVEGPRVSQQYYRLNLYVGLALSGAVFGTIFFPWLIVLEKAFVILASYYFTSAAAQAVFSKADQDAEESLRLNPHDYSKSNEYGKLQPLVTYRKSRSSPVINVATVVTAHDPAEVFAHINTAFSKTIQDVRIAYLGDHSEIVFTMGNSPNLAATINTALRLPAMPIGRGAEWTAQVYVPSLGALEVLDRTIQDFGGSLLSYMPVSNNEKNVYNVRFRLPNNSPQLLLWNTRSLYVSHEARADAPRWNSFLELVALSFNLHAIDDHIDLTFTCDPDQPGTLNSIVTVLNSAGWTVRGHFRARSSGTAGETSLQAFRRNADAKTPAELIRDLNSLALLKVPAIPKDKSVRLLISCDLLNKPGAFALLTGAIASFGNLLSSESPPFAQGQTYGPFEMEVEFSQDVSIKYLSQLLSNLKVEGGMPLIKDLEIVNARFGEATAAAIDYAILKRLIKLDPSKKMRNLNPLAFPGNEAPDHSVVQNVMSAEAVAEWAHDGQYRKAGTGLLAYETHPLEMVHRMLIRGVRNQIAIDLALLHDTTEDVVKQRIKAMKKRGEPIPPDFAENLQRELIRQIELNIKIFPKKIQRDLFFLTLNGTYRRYISAILDRDLDYEAAVKLWDQWQNYQSIYDVQDLKNADPKAFAKKVLSRGVRYLLPVVMIPGGFSEETRDLHLYSRQDYLEQLSRQVFKLDHMDVYFERDDHGNIIEDPMQAKRDVLDSSKRFLEWMVDPANAEYFATSEPAHVEHLKNLLKDLKKQLLVETYVVEPEREQTIARPTIFGGIVYAFLWLKENLHLQWARMESMPILHHYLAPNGFIGFVSTVASSRWQAIRFLLVDPLGMFLLGAASVVAGISCPLFGLPMSSTYVQTAFAIIGAAFFISATSGSRRDWKNIWAHLTQFKGAYPMIVVGHGGDADSTVSEKLVLPRNLSKEYVSLAMQNAVYLKRLEETWREIEDLPFLIDMLLIRLAEPSIYKGLLIKNLADLQEAFANLYGDNFRDPHLFAKAFWIVVNTETALTGNLIQLVANPDQPEKVTPLPPAIYAEIFEFKRYLSTRVTPVSEMRRDRPLTLPHPSSTILSYDDFVRSLPDAPATSMVGLVQSFVDSRTPEQPVTVLDIGLGYGIAWRQLSKRFGPKIEAYGLDQKDWYRKKLKKNTGLRQRYEELWGNDIFSSSNDLHLLIGDMTTIQFSKPMDIMVAVQSMQYAKDPLQAFANLYNQLPVNGLLLGMVLPQNLMMVPTVPGQPSISLFPEFMRKLKTLGLDIHWDSKGLFWVRRHHMDYIELNISPVHFARLATTEYALIYNFINPLEPLVNLTPSNRHAQIEKSPRNAFLDQAA